MIVQIVRLTLVLGSIFSADASTVSIRRYADPNAFPKWLQIQQPFVERRWISHTTSAHPGAGWENDEINPILTATSELEINHNEEINFDTADTNDDEEDPPSLSSASTDASIQQQDGGDGEPSNSVLIGAYLRYHAIVKIRQICEIGTEIWCHLPPFMPPFVVVASIPQKVASAEDAVKYVIPLISNRFVRKLAMSGFAVGAATWAHSQYFKKRRLAPLPLLLSSQSVSSVFLPPFLPAEGPVRRIESHQEQENGPSFDTEDMEGGAAASTSTSEGIRSPLAWLGMFIHQRNKKISMKRAEWTANRRKEIYDRLFTEQNSIRQSILAAYSSPDNPTKSFPYGESIKPSGYALVTGASQGIGRAIAVELARWKIPSILVARDVDKLVSLAYDIEACYGVRCCIIKADLSQPKAAERIYRATQKAQLSVPIVVSNAGFGWEGEISEMDVSAIQKMINVNVMAYSKLAQLYGQDMKTNRVGRFLMVSSITETCDSSPQSGMYAATKTFERSLSLSMAKEMEPYGVGVTCLIPGPVGDTQFRSRSNTNSSLIWYTPLFVRPAQEVAHQGVLGMLDGDLVVRPGIANWAYCNLFKPLISSRLEAVLVQAAWSPPSQLLPRSMRYRAKSTDGDAIDDLVEPQPNLNPRYEGQLPPRVLKVPLINRKETSNGKHNHRNSALDVPDKMNGSS